jgi:hypothetical protein
MEWVRQPSGEWKFGFSPRSHYHLFCSVKDNHAGFKRPDSHQLKFWFDELPEQLQKLMS